MNGVPFKEQNTTLRAGGNSNTIGLPVAISENLQHGGSMHFVSKWELEEHERNYHKARIIEMLKQSKWVELTELGLDELAEEIIKVMPPVYLAVLHQPPPMMVLSYNPFEFGMMDGDKEVGFLRPFPKEQFNKPNSHPDEN